MKWGVGTTLVGLCFGVTSLSAVIAERFRRGVRIRDAWTTSLPDGVIDGTNGAPSDLLTLKEVVADNLGLHNSWLCRMSIHLGVPSVATYMQALSVESNEGPTALSRELPGMLSGDCVSTCITDTSTSCEMKGRMLVAARRDTLQAYISGLGSLQRCVMSVSPVQVARYNLCALARSSLEAEALVVIMAEAGMIEVVSWSRGVVVDSERVEHSHEYTSIDRLFAQLVRVWGARRKPVEWLVMGDAPGQRRVVQALSNAGIDPYVIDPFMALSSLGCYPRVVLDEHRAVASSACADALGLLVPHINFKEYVPA